jgi:hypothetical protein
MADTNRHNAQVHRHEHTHITQDRRHGQQGAHMDTSHDTSTTTPPSAMPPGPGQRRLVLRIGPSSAAAWPSCRRPSFAVFGPIWALGRCATGAR